MNASLCRISVVFVGMLMCFVASAPAGVIITGETATSPNATNPSPPYPIVDNSGISIFNTDLSVDGGIIHSAADNGFLNMYWNEPTPAPADGSRYVEINLNAKHYVAGMRIWNNNQNDGPPFFPRLDVTSFSVETSPDGITWTPRMTPNITIGVPLPLATGLNNYGGTYFDLTADPWAWVQYVRIHVLHTNWAHYNPNDPDLYGGLSEVMFQTPEPSVAGVALLALTALCGVRRLRRRH